jgi:hypothetical protein
MVSTARAHTQAESLCPDSHDAEIVDCGPQVSLS